MYFNPLPQQGKTLLRLEEHLFKLQISIHFPNRGRHYLGELQEINNYLFQSTSPTGEDTCKIFYTLYFNGYFNPLPQQGKTHGIVTNSVFEKIFQSTSPTGEDTAGNHRNYSLTLFQSTSPTGEDTTVNPEKLRQERISIHFPNRGRHHRPSFGIQYGQPFQSTSPTGEDTNIHDTYFNSTIISIHFPNRGRHIEKTGLKGNCSLFQSTSPTGEDTISQITKFQVNIISIHFPNRGRHI